MMIVSTFKQEATTIGNTYLSLAYFLCLGTWPDHLTVSSQDPGLCKQIINIVMLATMSFSLFMTPLWLPHMQFCLLA